GWLPGEKMTPAQALRSFTLDAAYAAHQEKVIGSLEPGKWADFILIDRDVINGNPQDIWKTHVLQTWIAGELKYQAE
ncbi:MAG: amidohydrolase family protein, partial [Kangiellaceae bacterium]